MAQNNAAAIQMKDIHDIKPLVNIGIDPVLFHYILYGALGVILLGLLIVLFLYVKKRKREKTEPAACMTPDEAALAAIKSLSGRLNGDGRAFYFDLSLILRGYVHQRFEIGSLEMTTEELLPKIDRLNLDRKLKSNLRSFLISSDPVKFAGHPVSTEKMGKDLLFVTDLVKQTSSLNEDG